MLKVAQGLVMREQRDQLMERGVNTHGEKLARNSRLDAERQTVGPDERLERTLFPANYVIKSEPPPL